MKTHNITTYSASELKEQFPEAFKRAHQAFISSNKGYTPWMDETVGSLKACLKAAGVKLCDWSLGAYNRDNFIEIEFDREKVEAISGKRAFAWLENNLLSSLRVPWTGKARNDVRKYGSSYYAGKIKPGPLTGYCADENYLDSLRKDLLDGCTLKEAFMGLADICKSLLEDESKAQNEEDYFLEMAEGNGLEYTEEGEQF